MIAGGIQADTLFADSIRCDTLVVNNDIVVDGTVDGVDISVFEATLDDDAEVVTEAELEDSLNTYLNLDSVWIQHFVGAGPRNPPPAGDSLRFYMPGTFELDWDPDSNFALMRFENYSGAQANLHDTAVALGFLNYHAAHGDSCRSLVLDYETTSTDTSVAGITRLWLDVGGVNKWDSTLNIASETRTTVTMDIKKDGFTRGKAITLRVEVNLDNNNQEVRIYEAHLLGI
jgi:hypothetical protein